MADPEEPHGQSVDDSGHEEARISSLHRVEDAWLSGRPPNRVGPLGQVDTDALGSVRTQHSGSRCGVLSSHADPPEAARSPGVGSQVRRWFSFSQHEKKEPSTQLGFLSSLITSTQRRQLAARRVSGSNVASTPKLSASSPSTCRVRREGA